MSVEGINAVSNSQKLHRLPPPKRSRLTRHIGFCNNLNDYSEQVETGNKEKSDRKALLWGSLAALAIGGGIYLATRGRKSSSNMTSSLSKTGSQVAENSKKETNFLINSELIKDENLRSVISELNNRVEIIATSSFSVYLRNLKSKIYIKSITDLAKCESSEDLYKMINRIKTNHYDIPIEAFNCHKKIDFDRYIEKHKDKLKVIIPNNASPQEKMKLLIDDTIDKSKAQIMCTLSPECYVEALNDESVEVSKGAYDYLIKILNTQIKWLS